MSTLVSSGIGLARVTSVARQSISTVSTQLPATGDQSNIMAARGDLATRNRQDKEQGAQIDYRDCQADFRVDFSSDHEYRHLPGKTGTATDEKACEPHDPAKTWTSSPPPYSCVEEYEESASRVASPIPQHSLSRSTTVRGRLSCPVIIAQRRPEDKKCGFVRAYAPALLDCGIDKASFLDFVDSLNKDSEASSAFGAIEMAAFATGFAPSAIAQGVSPASIGTKLAKSKKVIRKTNDFLDRFNETLFKPHGVHCLVTTCKPDGDSSNGEVELLEAAPLIFPDDTVLRDGQESLGSFTAEDFDKRSHATYSEANPDLSLNMGPGLNFNSCYSDRNHNTNNSGLISLTTGIAVNLKGIRGARRGENEQQRGGDRRRNDPRARPPQIGRLRDFIGSNRSPPISGPRESVVDSGPEGLRQKFLGGARGSVKRSMKQDVLYLMIINDAKAEKVGAAVVQKRSHSHLWKVRNLAVTKGCYHLDGLPVSAQLGGGGGLEALGAMAMLEYT